MISPPSFIAALATSVFLCAFAEAEESFTLRTGEAARSATSGITFRFDGVLSDSRCPKDVNCVRAGEAVIRFSVETEDGKTEPLDFKVPPGGSDSARLRDVLITIVELNPQAESGKRIVPSDYEAKVTVSRE